MDPSNGTAASERDAEDQVSGGSRSAEGSGAPSSGRGAPPGHVHAAALAAVVADATDDRLPSLARAALQTLVARIIAADEGIIEIDAEIITWHQNTTAGRLLATIPDLGPLIASAIAATVPEASAFRSGRDLAAWLGLVPRQNSTGGKEHLSGVSKRSDRYIRCLLVTGAFTVLRSKRAKAAPWLIALRGRKLPLVAAVALANKSARITWAVPRRGEAFRPRPQALAA